MNCKICGADSSPIFKKKLLGKYNVSYYICSNCGFLETDDPKWLNEAYTDAITSLDVGLVSRNLLYSDKIFNTAIDYFNPAGNFLDYAGGYGLFVRLMRDKGLNYYRQDKYCDNLFAQNFDLEDIPGKKKFEFVTAFEVFEHLENPIDDIAKMLEYSDTLIFTTELLSFKDVSELKEWWYLTPETGQHISFFAKETLEYISNKFNLNFWTDGSVHMLTKRKFVKNPLADSKAKASGIEIESLTSDDYELAKKLAAEITKVKPQASELTKKKEKDLTSRLALALADEAQSNAVLGRIKSKNLILQKELGAAVASLKEKEIEADSLKDNVTTLGMELASIKSSKSWRVAGIIHRMASALVPKGSMRRKAAAKLFRAAKKTKNFLGGLRLYSEIQQNKSNKNKRATFNRDSKKIVYIGHSYHQKTKSTDFLIDYLKNRYDVTEVLDESWRGDGTPFPDLSFIDDSYLAVIFFQNLPPQNVLNNLKHGNVIYFPMYDAVGGADYSFWRQCRHMKVINFSLTLHKKIDKWGLKSLPVQYFPDPTEFFPGNSDEVFFWQRLTSFNIQTINNLLGKQKPKIHIHKAIDPGHDFVEAGADLEKKYQISYSEWFDTRDEMWDLIKEKGIYVAPREFEGIGLSFLEAMAMGKAVIAVDNPTMNEYIKNGETGYLFNLANPKPISLANVKQVQKNTYDYMNKGYQNWQKDKEKIIQFIEA